MTGLGALVVALPLAKGGMERWAWSGAGMALAVLLVLWAVRSVVVGRVVIPRSPLFWAFGLLLVTGLLQVIPSQGLVDLLSPNAAESWAQARAHGAVFGAPTISLLPYETIDQIRLLAVLAVAFFLLMANFRSEKVLFGLALVVMAGAAINALAGLAQFLTDSKWVLWMYRTFHLHALAGTFRNKNHFAFLVNMGLLTGIGAMLAVIMSRVRRNEKIRPELKRSLRQSLSSQKTWLSVILGMVLILFVLSLLLSYSRTGVSAGLATLTFFLIYLWWVKDRRWQTLAAGALVLAVMFGFGGHYFGTLSEALESAASGKDFSFLARLDAWQSAWRLTLEHPLAGIGLGAFRYVSPVHESGVMVDTLVFFVHNDWLELLCLAGIPVGLAVLGLAAWVVAGIVRRAWGYDHPLGWLAMGSFFCLVYVALHEFFDFNLQMPGNALTLLAVLTIAIRASQLAESRKSGHRGLPDIELELGIGGKALLVAAVAVVAALGVWQLYPTYAAGRSHSLLMESLDPNAPESPRTAAEEAEYRRELSLKVLSHTPNDFSALAALAEQEGVLGVDLYRKELCERLSRRLGYKVTPAELNSPRIVPLADRVAANLPPSARVPVERWFAEAARHFARAAGMAPTNGHLFASLALAWEREGLWRGYDWQRVVSTYYFAHQLYPSLGVVSNLCARGLWREYLRQERLGNTAAAQQTLEGSVALFRSALAQTPSLAQFVYDALWGRFADFSQLQAITPANLDAQERLYNFCYKRCLWPECLSLLERISQASRERPDVQTPETMGLWAFVRRSAKTKDEVELEVARRRVQLYGALGQWEQWRRARADLVRTMRGIYAEDLADAAKLEARGNLPMAGFRLRYLLSLDPWWPQAIAALVANDVSLGRYRQAQDMSLRLALSRELVDAATLEVALEAVNHIPAQGTGHSPGVGKFDIRLAVRAALLTKAGRWKDADEDLRGLIGAVDQGLSLPWSQQHLLYYFAGECALGMGDDTSAALAFIGALHICPGHLDSARRLAELREGGAVERALAGLGPEERQKAQADIERAMVMVNRLSGATWLEIEMSDGLDLAAYCVRPSDIPLLGASNMDVYWERTAVLGVGDTKVLYNFYAGGGSRFGLVRKLGQTYDDSTWRLGELIRDELKLIPFKMSLQQYHRAPEPGQYFMELKLISGSLATQTLLQTENPLVVPAFSLSTANDIHLGPAMPDQ